MRRISGCSICDLQAVYMGCGFSFLPVVCCQETEERHREARRIVHRKKEK